MQRKTSFFLLMEPLFFRSCCSTFLKGCILMLTFENACIYEKYHPKIPENPFFLDGKIANYQCFFIGASKPARITEPVEPGSTAASIIQMTYHNVSRFDLFRHRLHELAFFHAFRAPGMEFAAGRRIGRRRDASFQDHPVHLHVRIRDRD